ncbi:hypothetical protein [uncultured Psychrobacter sp.]|uniref:hypothetical protein n=1 Tax=uncultured Psychrobacter sp. TaxID=259303 RepID=UPI002591828B|nr:hypothetical protein [uncultured Psychrobacter sp.]
MIDSKLEGILFKYLLRLNKDISYDLFIKELRKANSLRRLKDVDANIDHILWPILPQLILQFSLYHSNDLSIYKSFKSSHVSNKSFILIPPPFQDTATRLIESLTESIDVQGVTYRAFTEDVTYSLYGGYPWHEPYLASVNYLDILDKPASIILLENMTKNSIDFLNAFKNENREKLADEIIINRELINTEMNGIIRCFHCPDNIENVRQLLNLGIIKRTDIYENY